MHMLFLNVHIASYTYTYRDTYTRRTLTLLIAKDRGHMVHHVKIRCSIQ